MKCRHNGGRPYNAAGYFTDREKAAYAVMNLEKLTPAGIYLVLNEINPDLLARSPDKITPYLDTTTSDVDITPGGAGGTWISIPSGRRESRQRTRNMTRQSIWRWIAWRGCRLSVGPTDTCGFRQRCSPVVSIDLPNGEESTALVRGSIQAVADKWNTAEMKVDNLFNAARIWKLYGTTARKGHSMPDRPHRVAKLLGVPDSLQVVSRAQLESLAATGRSRPRNNRPTATGMGQPFTSRLDVPKWLTARGVAFTRKDKATSDGRTVYLLESCPFNAEHGKAAETSVMQGQDGTLSARACTTPARQTGGKNSGTPSASPITTIGTHHLEATKFTVPRQWQWVTAANRGRRLGLNRARGLLPWTVEILEKSFRTTATIAQVDFGFPGRARSRR